MRKEPSHLPRLFRRLLAASTAAALACGLLSAHDFWIQPSGWAVEPGAVLSFRLFVGGDFQGEPFARYAALIDRFVVVGPEDEKPALGLEGADPAGVARLDRAGLHAAGYRSRRSYLRLGAEKFEKYLREEGLERISEIRASAGETGSPVREAFSRCAKALVQVGPADPEDRDRRLGFRLELVAGRNPYTLHPGERLPVRLLFEGRPLAGALVVFMNQNAPEDRQTVRTNQQGEASAVVSKGGLWMVKSVHMVRPAEGVDANWESLWASLTFDMPGAGNSASTRPRSGDAAPAEEIQ